MHGMDILIVTVIGVSALISLVRGFVKEALSVAGWIAAVWVSASYASVIADLLVAYISPPELRFIAGFALLFVASLFMAGMLNFLVGQLVRKSGLSGTDRAVGMVFGIARGGVLVGVLVLLASLTTLPQGVWWRESLLVSHFEDMAIWMRGELPVEVRNHLAVK